jgi:hypothetical protein
MYVKPPGQSPSVEPVPRKIVELVDEHTAGHDDSPPPSASVVDPVEVLPD